MKLSAGDEHSTVCTITGFVTGPRADDISRMGKDIATTRFLAQLDEMFQVLHGVQREASARFVESLLVDWCKEPFIHGGYSAPGPGNSGRQRSELGSPVAGRVFFAGEATNSNLNNCAHGAMETADRAAKEVLAAVRQKMSGRLRVARL